MSAPPRSPGILLTLALVVTGTASLAADVTRFDDLLRIVRSQPDPTIVLEQCGDTVFTLNAAQRAQLARAGAPASLIAALQDRRMGLDDVQNFALIVDCSGSMKESMPDGRNKMDAAKAVLTELIGKIPDGLNVSLTLYGHEVAAKCRAVEVKRSLAPIDAGEREELTKVVAGLEPLGHTPIAGALRAAGGTLEGAKGLSQVVLVTDGMETCHEDPAAVAESLTLKHKLRRVEVVGLGLKSDEKAAVTRIARRGRGKFYDAQTADALAPALKKVVRVALKTEEVKPQEDETEEQADLPPRVKVLVESLRDEDEDVRRSAAEGLGKMGARAKGAAPALAKLIAHERGSLYAGRDIRDKDAAIASLKTLDPGRIEPALVAASKVKNAEVKQWANSRLAQLDESPDSPPKDEPRDDGAEDLPPRVKVLVAALEDKDEDVRRGAAEGLGKMGARAKGAAPALAKLIAHERGSLYAGRDIRDKDAAIASLKTLDPGRIEPALVAASKVKNAEVRRWANSRLATLDEEEP